MALEIPMLNCSRPVQLLLQKTTRCGIVHSVFHRAINLAFDDTLIVLLSAEQPRMPNGIRVPTDAFAASIEQVYEGMELQIQPCDTCWEPRPPVASCHWQREIVAQHVSILIHKLPGHIPSEGLAPIIHMLLDVGTDVSRPIGNDGRPQGSTPPSPSTPAPTIHGSFVRKAHLSCETRSTQSMPEAYIVGAGADDGGGRDPCGRPCSSIVSCGRPCSSIVSCGRPCSSIVSCGRPCSSIVSCGRPCSSIVSCGRPCSTMALLSTPLARIALPLLYQLACASWLQDRAMLATAVSKLAGLGPGLTPSGDDVLGGFASVMALLSPYLSSDALERVWIAELIAQVAGPRTTLISRVLLDYAAKGEVAEQIGDLLLALARPLSEQAAVWRAARRVLAFGATSGADTLLGILLALRVLEGGFDDRCMI